MSSGSFVNVKSPPKKFSDLFVAEEGEVKDGEQVDPEEERVQTYEPGEDIDKPFRHFFMVKTSGVTKDAAEPFIPLNQPNIVYHLEVICQQRIVHMHGILETFLPVTVADLTIAYPGISFSTVYDIEGAFEYIEFQRVKVLCDEGKPLSIATHHERLYYPRTNFTKEWSQAGYNAFETGFGRLKKCSEQVYGSMMRNYNKWAGDFRRSYEGLKGRSVPGLTEAIFLEADTTEQTYGSFQRRVVDTYMQLQNIGTAPRTEILEVEYGALSTLTLADTSVRELPVGFLGARIILLKVDLTKQPQADLTKVNIVINKLKILAHGVSVLGVYYTRPEPAELPGGPGGTSEAQPTHRKHRRHHRHQSEAPPAAFDFTRAQVKF